MDNTTNSIAYVRTQESPATAPPVSTGGVGGWLKENLFATPRDTVLTIVTFLFLVWIIPPIVDWAFISAVWTGESREDCIVPGAGACWAFVEAKFGQFMYGRYPLEERWRVNSVRSVADRGPGADRHPVGSLQAREMRSTCSSSSRFLPSSF